MVERKSSYRGRLAPSPTGYLHLGHARTFWTAQQRALAARSTSSGQADGTLILRNDDLDAARCRPEFVAAMIEDLAWFGFRWSEGPDLGGPHAPYDQSKRLAHYAAAFEQLRAAGAIYPCTCSRKDVASAAGAPHEVAPASAGPAEDHSRAKYAKAPQVGPAEAGPTPANDEPHYPGTCRPENLSPAERVRRAAFARDGVNWRFRVPDGEMVAFTDGHFGPQHAIAGREIADFLVWRKDGTPSYQLACVVDDAAMHITEVVRGADLIVSTFRQLLLYRALGAAAPAFFHCPLVTDEAGVRLAKRHGALSLRALRAAGRTPEELRADWSE